MYKAYVYLMCKILMINMIQTFRKNLLHTILSNYYLLYFIAFICFDHQTKHLSSSKTYSIIGRYRVTTDIYIIQLKWLIYGTHTINTLIYLTHILSLHFNCT